MSLKNIQNLRNIQERIIFRNYENEKSKIRDLIILENLLMVAVEEGDKKAIHACKIWINYLTKLILGE